MDEKEMKSQIKGFQQIIEQVRKEAARAVVGQQAAVRSFIRGIISNGNILVEGVPGIAKTLIVRTLSVVMGCEFKRIQFTPDLLPTDIIGISTYEKERGFYVLKGPIFSNFILGDEINRAPPKVQSALLEGMQEKQVTIGKETFPLPKPFFVLATQNPIEQLGTFPLPEAQLDRFLFKINVGYPTIEEEQEVLERNMSLHKFEDFNLAPLLNPDKIIAMQKLVQSIYLDKKIEMYIVKIVDATRYPKKYGLRMAKYCGWGASPRASIGLFIASKAEALLRGDTFVTPAHVKTVAPDILRHRLVVNYEGQSEGIGPDDLINEILTKIPVP
ncbi:MAG: MoxR family ATPase [archaeon]